MAFTFGDLSMLAGVVFFSGSGDPNGPVATLGQSNIASVVRLAPGQFEITLATGAPPGHVLLPLYSYTVPIAFPSTPLECFQVGTSNVVRLLATAQDEDTVIHVSISSLAATP